MTMNGWSEGKHDITPEHKGKPTEDVAGALNLVPARVSPIALDIDKSGAIETTSLSASHTYFDIDNDTFAERVQWISPTDGWLAIDKNANGKIDNQSELFGDDGTTKAYAKLAALDTNHDGKITSADTDFASLRVWVDANSDGASQTAELKTLSSLGITSLSLETAAGSLSSTFVRSGVTYNAHDILLDTDQMDSWYQGTPAEITPAALALPHSRGYGDVKSMEYAASGNAALAAKLQALQAMPISGLDGYYGKLEAMVEEWTGTGAVARTGVSPWVDARHAAIMGHFSGMGTDYYTKNIPSDPTHFEPVEAGYARLMGEFSTRFIAQGALAGVFGNPTYNSSDDKLHFSLSYSQILSNAKAGAPTDTADINVYWSETAHTLLEYISAFGVTGPAMQTAIDTAAGYHVQVNQPWNYVAGTEGNDLINGTAAANYLHGNAGADTVYGADGNDYILGGTGNDLLRGGTGNDSIADYDGNNTIYGDAGDDTINGGTGASKLYGGSGNDYILSGNGSETLSGGDGDDRLYSRSGNDRINGDAGNDYLYGGTGSSTLSGGLGADTLSGGAGKDTFLYTKGDGDDMIVKAATVTTTDVLKLTGIAHTEVTFSAVADAAYVNEPNSVKINVAGGGSILLDHYLDGTDTGRIESLQFSDGTVMTAAQIIQATAALGTSGNDTLTGGGGHDVLLGFDGADSILGSAGNDTAYGQGGNDTLYGGAGNDLLAGGEGSDTYHYARGDGDDTVADFGSGTQDTLVLDNINRSDVSFSAIDRDGNGAVDSVKLTIAGGGSILLQDQIFLSAYYTIDSLKFGDGTVMTAQAINNSLPTLAQSGTEGNDHLYGDAHDNVILGNGGNDQLIGNAGNDTIWGDDGNDTINGGDGADQLIGDNGNGNGTGNDSIDGGAGNDTLFGEGANDMLNGGDGDDQLIGAAGDDALAGGIGNDTLWGGDGNDTLSGGAGKDQMTGGAGADVFIFSALADNQAANADYIWDFTHGVDKLSVHGLGFVHLDTDGGQTEAGELRFSATNGITTIISDQTGFTFQLNGTFTAATLTESDFIW